MNAPVDVSFFARAAKPLNSYRKFWAARFGTAPFLPMSRAEMDKLGWDSCDIIIVTGDAYVDHPSFGIAGHDDDVAAVPTQFVHFRAAHRQERRRAEAGRPELAVAVQRFGGAREKGNVNGGVHGGASWG